MEILKTSEALETQILEDARKKASRVLEAVDKEIEAMRAAEEARAAGETKRLDAECEAKLRALRQELASSLPLDFMRTRLAATEQTLREALEEFFTSMKADELERILAAMLRKPAAAFRGTRVTVSCTGIDAAAARRIVQAAMPDAAIEDVQLRTDPPKGGGPAERTATGIILATVDRRIRFRATLDELAGLLMEERRGELATALLGKDAEAL
jgi:V/A-type H+-transporting ATPase subunit E